MFLNSECGLLGWYVCGTGIDFGLPFFSFSMVEFNTCMIAPTPAVWIPSRVTPPVWGSGECPGKELRFSKQISSLNSKAMNSFNQICCNEKTLAKIILWP